MELKYIVNDLPKYKNIRQVLKNEFNISNRLITKLKKSKLIYLNNYQAYLDKSISLGDIVKCIIDFDEDSENIIPVKMNLKILYEDDFFCLFKKLLNCF